MRLIVYDFIADALLEMRTVSKEFDEFYEKAPDKAIKDMGVLYNDEANIRLFCSVINFKSDGDIVIEKANPDNFSTEFGQSKHFKLMHKDGRVRYFSLLPEFPFIHFEKSE